MNDHVAKPFDLANLVEVIGRHVKTVGGPAKGNGKAAPRAPLEGGALDVEGALARFCDDVGIYRRALESYVVEAPKLVDRIAALAAKGAAAEPREIGLLLHSLKGSSAQIGADPLAAMLARAESVPAVALEPWLPDIASLSRQACEAARTVAARWADEGGESGGDKPVLEDELERLHLLLVQSNMAAVDGYEALRRHYAGEMTREFDELGAAVHKLDFAGALKICEAMQAELRSSSKVL
jgi:hypothetical protein